MTNGTPTCYITVDHLGSMRLMTDSSGNPQRLYDYQPFGTELPGGNWGRNTAMGYQASPDDVGPKYTGQSRDLETGLDWFQVRHMSGAQGRFQSVDPGNAGANPADPQTWNMYAYVGNNPMSSTDPSGMDAGAGLLLCGGGPISCGVGLGIDIGLGLWDLFGGGGHTPALQNFPFPDQVAGGGVAGSGSGGMGPYGSSFVDAQSALSNGADFTAGVVDSFSLGLSRLLRKSLPGGDPRDLCSPYYKAGEWGELGAEVALSAASFGLNTMIKGVSRTAVRHAAEKRIASLGIQRTAGQQLHHLPPLFGHPGGLPTLFPTGGLPIWMNTNTWTLWRVEGTAGNAAAHRTLRAWERAGTAAVNPPLTVGRVIVDTAGGCRQ
jgi:RHS repeat-associated protein